VVVGKLDMLPVGSLRDAFWAAAERVAPEMNLQGVPNTVWALATVGMTPAGSPRDRLWAAVERVAPSLKLWWHSGTRGASGANGAE
jgi:hypothetical protein